MIVAVRYLIPHPDAVAELGDLDVALHDGTQPIPEGSTPTPAADHHNAPDPRARWPRGVVTPVRVVRSVVQEKGLTVLDRGLGEMEHHREAEPCDLRQRRVVGGQPSP